MEAKVDLEFVLLAALAEFWRTPNDDYSKRANQAHLEA